MCLITIDYFDVCGHNSYNDPNVAAYCDIQKCPEWDRVKLNCPRLVAQNHHHYAKCPRCSERLREFGLWYKHCYLAQVCDHEYGHMETNLERLSFEPDIVLVTPQRGVLCPECKGAGYDNRPGGRNPAPKTASVMPLGFENLPRAEISQIQRVSQVPVSILRPVSPSRASASRIPSNAYAPGGSRVPIQAISRAAVYDSQDSSVRPGRSGLTYPSRPPPQSQIERESSRAFEARPSKSATSKPESPTSSPAHLAPHNYHRTRAPPADAEGPDLDEVLSKATTTISIPLSPPGATVWPGKPLLYKPLIPRRSDAASKPKTPGAAPEATTEGSRRSLMSSQSEVGRRSSVQRSENSRRSRGRDSAAEQTSIVVNSRAAGAWTASPAVESEVSRNGDMVWEDVEGPETVDHAVGNIGPVWTGGFLMVAVGMTRGLGRWRRAVR